MTQKKVLTITVPHSKDPKKQQKQEWKIFNDNSDMVTSCHAYWGRDSIPHMIKEVDEQLEQSENKSERLDLMIYKKNLETMLEISVRLGDRDMSFVDSNGDSEIVDVDHWTNHSEPERD